MDKKTTLVAGLIVLDGAGTAKLIDYTLDPSSVKVLAALCSGNIYRELCRCGLDGRPSLCRLSHSGMEEVVDP